MEAGMQLRQHFSDCRCYVVPPSATRGARDFDDVTDLVAFLGDRNAGAVGSKLRRRRSVLNPGVLLLLLAAAAIVTGAAWLPPGMP
jgi:hypothetical protein